MVEHAWIRRNVFAAKGELQAKEVIKTFPVDCIRSSSQIVVRKCLFTAGAIQENNFKSLLAREPKHVKNALGSIKSNDKLISILKIRWHDSPDLIAATDGGLGDEIGSSGYLLFFMETIYRL